MAQLIEIQKVEVGPEYLTARVHIADGAPLMTSDDLQATTRVYNLMPHIVDHVCLGDAGETFKDCMGATELAHLLEHMTVELLAQTNIAGDITSGKTYPASDDARAFDIQLSCRDDVLTAAALSSAVWIADWAFSGGGDPQPDVEAIVEGLCGLVASLGDEPQNRYAREVENDIEAALDEKYSAALAERQRAIGARLREIEAARAAAEAEAAEILAREAEDRAAREAELRAQEEARRAAEEARRAEEERQAREAEERAREEARRAEEERQAREEARRAEEERLIAETRRAAEEHAREEARRAEEERAAREAERRAREAEERAREAEERAREAEERAREEARRAEEERAAREAEERAREEARRAEEERAAREAEERAREEARRAEEERQAREAEEERNANEASELSAMFASLPTMEPPVASEQLSLDMGFSAEEPPAGEVDVENPGDEGSVAPGDLSEGDAVAPAADGGVEAEGEPEVESGADSETEPEPEEEADPESGDEPEEESGPVEHIPGPRRVR